MAIQHHPLSNAALGEYGCSNTVRRNGELSTEFLYKNGSVILDNNWRWITILNSSLTEGTNDNPISDWERTNLLCKHCGSTHELGINEQGICFGCMYEGDTNNKQQSSVAPQLDQHSIDGMDDMLEQQENADYSEWCKEQDKILHRSEADEASTNNYSSSINCHENMSDNREGD